MITIQTITYNPHTKSLGGTCHFEGHVVGKDLTDQNTNFVMSGADCPIKSDTHYWLYVYCSAESTFEKVPVENLQGTMSPGTRFKHVYGEVFIRVSFNLGVAHNGGADVDFYKVYKNGVYGSTGPRVEDGNQVNNFIDTRCITGYYFDIQVSSRNAIGWSKNLSDPTRILCAQQPSLPRNVRIADI